MDSDVPDYAEHVLKYNEFMRPARRASVEFVKNILTRESRLEVLDAGCGPGGNVPMFVDVFDGEIEIVGADFSEPHLRAARRLVEDEEFEAFVTIEEVDLAEELPFEHDRFDLIWASDVLFPNHFESPAEIVANLKPHLRPGGLMAIFSGGWSRSMLLPGYPRLERFLQNAIAVQHYVRDEQGVDNPERAETWLRETGFTDVDIEFPPVLHRSGPGGELDPDVADYVELTFEDFDSAVEAHGAEVGMDEQDRELWAALSNPEHPDYVLKNDDYYCAAFPLLVVGRRS